MNRTRLAQFGIAALVLLLAGLLYWKGGSRQGGSVPHASDPAPPEKIMVEDPVPRIVEDTPIPEPTGPDRSELRDWIGKLGRATLLRDKRRHAKLKRTAPKILRSDLPYLWSLLSDPLHLSAGTAELLKWYRLPESIPHLVKMIGGEALLGAKGVAIETLAIIGGDTAGEALIRLLTRDPDTGIRARAATALARFDTPEAHRAIVDALRSESSSLVRQYLGKALRNLSSPEMVEILLATMPNEPDAGVVAELAVATYRSGGEDSLPRILEILDHRPEAKDRLRDFIHLQEDAWYRESYPASFFREGGKAIPFLPRYRKIGITIAPGSTRFPDNLKPVFRSSPLDRYRDFFYLRLENEWLDDLSSGTRTPRAYDVDGRAIPGGIPANDLDGAVHLRFLSPDDFSPGILGFTEGSRASVTSTSLLHEFGHALGDLADEYDHEAASNAGGANVDLPGEDPKWSPLIGQGHVGDPFPRRERVIPSNNCYMNNHPTDDRWCPVCQLALVARLCELSGASVPW